MLLTFMVNLSQYLLFFKVYHFPKISLSKTKHIQISGNALDESYHIYIYIMSNTVVYRNSFLFDMKVSRSLENIQEFPPFSPRNGI